MQRSEFTRRPRERRLFDIWTWTSPVHTSIGDLPVELHVECDAEPSDAMLEQARALADYASAHGETLLDLIFGHYKYAERKGWLEFWSVPAGIGRGEILRHVDAVELTVVEDLTATVFVDPHWDPEHKLDLTFADGRITEVNGQRYSLENGILRREA